MRKIPRKNYYMLAVLIFATIAITFALAYTYKNREQVSSTFYKYANKITGKEFDEYMLETDDSIIYIADKYDLTNEEFEKAFMEKLNELNLKDKLIYIDRSELSKKFTKNLLKNYNINIKVEELPIIIVIIDNNFIKSERVQLDSDVNTIIDYEAFE